MSMTENHDQLLFKFLFIFLTTQQQNKICIKMYKRESGI